MCEVGEFARFGPKQCAQLREIYERACQVKANLPQTHIACIAAEKLIAAFDAGFGPQLCRPLEDIWLGAVTAHGNA
jgi:hypothetical protein